MPSQKNQHYVPRCALKPFTRDQEGKAIHVFNISAQKMIEDAPVKSQCSRDYFYGKDLKLENMLKELEGQYARIVRSIEDGAELNADDADTLLFFINIQARRTARAVHEATTFFNGMAEETFKYHQEQRPPGPSHQEVVAASIMLGIDMQSYTRDLKFIILRNQTRSNLITSDNPAVMTNAFSLERLRESTFGIGSAGTIIALPISPRFCAFLFDIGVYTVSIPAGTRYVKVTDPNDIRALNELQHLHADRNIYYATDREAESIAEQSRRTRGARVAVGGGFATLIRDKAWKGEVYRRGTVAEEQKSAESVVMASFNQPKPSIWPSFLKYRSKPVFVDTKSAAGHMRPTIVAIRAERRSR
jgi:hypothetical protein